MRERVRAVGSFLWERGGVSPWGGAPFDSGWKLCSNEELGVKVAASPRIYIGRCPKVVGSAIRGNAFPTYGGANPVSLRSTAPSRGRGENVGRFECIDPSFLWKEVPAGRRLGDAERSEKGASQAGDLRKHPNAADAVPLPRVGKVANEASRIGF